MNNIKFSEARNSLTSLPYRLYILNDELPIWSIGVDNIDSLLKELKYIKWFEKKSMDFFLGIDDETYRDKFNSIKQIKDILKK